MNTSVFNPEAFEQTIIDQENQTSFIPVPEGDYQAYIEDYAFRTFTNEDQSIQVVLNVDWVIPDEALAEQLGFDEVKVPQRVYLDLDDNGQLEFGTNKNVGLGRLRAALGLNKPGFQWQSLRGQFGTISVGQREASDGSGNIYSNVRKVAPKQ